MVTDTRADVDPTRRAPGPPSMDLLQAAVVARRYFLDRRSKTEIADELGLSRFKVARLLDSAMSHGVVRVEINAPYRVDTALGTRLQQRFGLAQAWVVDGGGAADAALRTELGRLGAAVIVDLLAAEDVLGVSWGRSVRAVVDALTAGGLSLPPCPVVQIAGGLPDRLCDGAVELVARLAEHTGGPTYPLHAPLHVIDPATANRLRAEPTIARTLQMFASLTVVLLGIGNESSLVTGTVAPQPDGVVAAEVCGLLLSDDGVVLEGPPRIASSVEQLRSAPAVVAVAGGADKARAIGAALAARLVTHLVTDREAADRVLFASAGPGPQ
jgi:DNA-binding transcriptional regulator LsrR (DeoR family)